MSTAISIGTTGLTASSKQMDVIGNNLANSNTLGFKASATYFASMLNQSLSSGGSIQVGSGVSVASVGTLFQQGAFETTGNATDLAIDGEGFFIVQDLEGGVYYTRAGNLHISKEGYLVDNNNYKVLGYGRTRVGEKIDEISPISLKNVQSIPQATTLFSMGVNLNDSSESGEKFTVSQTVYDSKGAQHNLSTIFQKTENPGTWGFTIKLDSDEGDTDKYCGVIFDADGNLYKIYQSDMTDPETNSKTPDDRKVTIDSVNYGQIYPQGNSGTTTSNIVLTYNTGNWSATAVGIYKNMSLAFQGNKLSLDLDGKGGADIILDVTGTWKDNDTISFDLSSTVCDLQDLVVTFPELSNGATIGDDNAITWKLKTDEINKLTGYSSASVVQTLNADGYPAGVLKSLSFDKDGTITGFFTNGQTSNLGSILLANFPNPGGLKKVGNYFAETIESGTAIKNYAGTGGLGEIISNTLELSNVDTAKEFISMIQAQRAYQACARVITTANDMLTELMNIKR